MKLRMDLYQKLIFYLMKRILLNTLFIICPLASYAGDKLSREEPFSFIDISRYSI